MLPVSPACHLQSQRFVEVQMLVKRKLDRRIVQGNLKNQLIPPGNPQNSANQEQARDGDKEHSHEPDVQGDDPDINPVGHKL